jgi:hypothetical protein
MKSNAIKLQWISWLVTLATTYLGGLFILPFLRSWPPALHAFVIELGVWHGRVAILAVSAAYIFVCINYFQPTLSQLRHFSVCPPLWFAWLLGSMLLMLHDLAFGLGPEGHRATSLEWVCYFAVPVIIIWLIHRLSTRDNTPSNESPVVLIDDVSQAPWEVVERWLSNNAIAEYDFLDHQNVAARLHGMLKDGMQSLGIVGKFGTGKSSLVESIFRLESSEFIEESKQAKLLLVYKSCWGFDDSATAVHALLRAAVEKLSMVIDVVRFRGLPEKFKSVFSTASSWSDTFSVMLSQQNDPVEQLRQLAALAAGANRRIVFVIEDLDRNSSRNFDAQEILAFLQQLKEIDNISFILTNGLESKLSIDFLKLCDHTHLVMPMKEQLICTLINRVRKRCLDQEIFKFVKVTDDRDYAWDSRDSIINRDQGVLSDSQAVSALIGTPRALRHCLNRTYATWQVLYGEIAWDDLFSLNIIRQAAPECFAFLLREWTRFHSGISRGAHTNQQDIANIRSALNEEWQKLSSNAEWDPRAVRNLLYNILPAAEEWLEGINFVSFNSQQRISHERYWLRAVNEQIPDNEIRDQAILRDLEEWVSTPTNDCSFIESFCSEDDYANVSELFFLKYFHGNSEQMLLLGRHVFSTILHKNGKDAGQDSLGFLSICQLFRMMGGSAQSRTWLEARIEEAIEVSLEFVNWLWLWPGGSREFGILLREDREQVRRYVLETMRRNLQRGSDLAKILSTEYPYSLRHLVFDGGNDDAFLVGIEHWKWLSPALVEAIDDGDSTVAMQTAYLLQRGRERDRAVFYECDTNVLHELFGEDGPRLIQCIESLTEKMPLQHVDLVKQVVNSTRSQADASGIITE